MLTVTPIEQFQSIKSDDIELSPSNIAVNDNDYRSHKKKKSNPMKTSAPANQIVVNFSTVRHDEGDYRSANFDMPNDGGFFLNKQ